MLVALNVFLYKIRITTDDMKRYNMSALAITSLYVSTLALAVSQDSTNEYVIKHVDDHVKMEVFDNNSIENQELTDWVNGVNQKHFYSTGQISDGQNKPSIHLKLRINKDEN